MAMISPFPAFRPPVELAAKVAARPYDVLNSAEARAEAKGNEYSFLKVTKPEIDLPEEVDQHAEEVYEKGRDNLDQFIASGVLIQDEENCIYLYELTMDEHVQTGIVALSSVKDYFDDVIKKHEYTRPVKERDRIKHMRTLGAHVGPVFLTYPNVADIDLLIEQRCEQPADYDFTLPDGIRHRLWVVKEQELVQNLCQLFADKVPATYIADGHHRAASSAKVGQAMADSNPGHNGQEPYNHFLSVLFPDNQMKILDYNRVVKDLNGHTEDYVLQALRMYFHISSVGSAFKPKAAGEFGMYLNRRWYKLVAKEEIKRNEDPVLSLDISLLQAFALDPIFNIKDQRTDERIDFVGGIRGLEELEKRVDSGEMAVAFSMYPVSIQQLINIADAGEVMPPKSTWFEPKLRSGLLVHRFTNL